MLNRRGGYVLFGVTPEGIIVGQQVSERTLEEVSAEIQRIDPPAFPEIERVRVIVVWRSQLVVDWRPDGDDVDRDKANRLLGLGGA